MATDPVPQHHSFESEPSLELPVDELIARAWALPPRERMVIDDLTPEEGAAFLKALKS